MTQLMDQPLLSSQLSLYHYFCLRCDRKEFSISEVNENAVIDYRVGEITCGKCGEVLTDRMVNSSSEVIMYQEDFDNGVEKKARSSLKSDYLGSDETVFLNGPENLRKAVERAQRAISSRKDKIILGKLHLVNELCSKMNLTSAIKVC